MKLIWKVLVLVTLLSAFSGTAFASIINGGFETGTLAGWGAQPLTTVVESATSFGGSVIMPVEGMWFLRTEAGQPDVPVFASQAVQGAVFSGYASFDGADSAPFDDFAFVRIFDSSGNLVGAPWSRSIISEGDFGFSSWAVWLWTAPFADVFTLQLGVTNVGDSLSPSFAYFDDIRVTSAVPEPASIVLLIIGGVVGVVIRLRRYFLT